MSKHSTLVAIVAIGLSGSAFAQSCACPAGTGTQLSNQNQINAVLLGNTVCVGSAPTWDAQEQHIGGGVLRDFKRGAGDPTDPTAQIGNWAVTGGGSNAIVTYTYGGTSYSYGVCSTGTSAVANQAVGFCPAAPSPGTATSGTLRIGAVGC